MLIGIHTQMWVQAGKGLLAVTLILSLSFWNNCTLTSRETRALWVVRDAMVSPESIARVVNDAVEGGFNTLLVQVRGRGDAFYRSKLIPRAEQLSRQPSHFDPLQTTIELARQQGLKVHAWINLLLVSSLARLPRSREHVALRHPDWLLTPSDLVRKVRSLPDGDPRQLSLRSQYFHEQKAAEGLFLDPALPEVQVHLLKMVGELVSSYQIDGLHLDYVRYPGTDPAYGLGAITQFVRSLPERPIGPEGLSTAQSLTIAGQYPQEWNQFRRNQVTRLVSRIQHKVSQEDPQILLSAAVVADPNRAYNSCLQDWQQWLKAGILDVVCPMSYTPRAMVFEDWIRTASQTSSQSRLWAGIGAYKLDGAGIIEQVKLSRRLDADGFVIFSYNTLVASRDSRQNLWAPLASFLTSDVRR